MIPLVGDNDSIEVDGERTVFLLTSLAARGNLLPRLEVYMVLYVIWDLDDDPRGNVQHIAEHGITKAEVLEVLAQPET